MGGCEKTLQHFERTMEVRTKVDFDQAHRFWMEIGRNVSMWLGGSDQEVEGEWRLRLPRLHNFCKPVNAPCNRKRKCKRDHF